MIRLLCITCYCVYSVYCILFIIVRLIKVILTRTILLASCLLVLLVEGTSRNQLSRLLVILKMFFIREDFFLSSWTSISCKLVNLARCWKKLAREPTYWQPQAVENKQDGGNLGN